MALEAKAAISSSMSIDMLRKVSLKSLQDNPIKILTKCPACRRALLLKVRGGPLMILGGLGQKREKTQRLLTQEKKTQLNNLEENKAQLNNLEKENSTQQPKRKKKISSGVLS